MASSRGDIPTLQDLEIEQRVGTKALRRGWEYFQKGALRQLRRQGKTLSGLCMGTSIHPYRIRVLFNETGITEAECTCPIGQGGYCKHVAALLVAWRERPQDFLQLEELERLLSRCTRRELVELVQRLLELRPELEASVYSWTPGLKAERTTPDAAVYRSQAKAILAQASRTDQPDWQQLTDRLMALVEIAQSFTRQQESEQASVVYGALLEEMLSSQHVEQMFQHPLQQITEACVEGLKKVLADRDVPPDVRTRILKTLLALVRLNLQVSGSLREDVVEVFREQTSPTEKSLLSQWIESLAGLSDSTTTRHLWGGLLLELGGQELDFDSFARICRTTGRYFDLVRRLVLWGRLPEALQEAHHLAEDELLQLADLLVAAGQSAQAEALVQKRLQNRSSGPDIPTGSCPREIERQSAQADRCVSPLADWLTQHRRRLEQQNQLVDLAEQMFRLQPSFEAFLQLRQAASSVGRWECVRSRLLAHLEQTSQWGLLARIFLEEKELARALALAQTHPADALESWELQIAQAAERLYPADALEIYRRRVDRLVAQHSRPSYAEACRLLRKIRSLMRRCGTAKQWPAYLTDFRTRYQGLPALQEELAKAGL
ncbi:MAG: SWIM zinc finger family protein [Thermoguttaceae bacterium]|nr:SWIM zinc finger family protein [Thermoguttaceae bacterium]MDW8036830.1 SWIM zinc finger family protein [Thermoguttaceae bacterium]